MKTGDLRTAKLIRTQIRSLQPSIYDSPATELTGLFYSPPELQALLRDELVGRGNLDELPVRTRSKVAKTLVCEALGYTAPTTFAKVNPRLRHANVDVYVQQASNLQIWNQEVDAARRYVNLIVRNSVIADVQVIAGPDLAQFDTTGTLTLKFQANRIYEDAGSVLISARDTEDFVAQFNPRPKAPSLDLPAGRPLKRQRSGHRHGIPVIDQSGGPNLHRSRPDPGTQPRQRGAPGGVRRPGPVALRRPRPVSRHPFPASRSQAATCTNHPPGAGVAVLGDAPRLGQRGHRGS